jgi:6-pyruvoyltetrahydropterin/6-carboxytetrahydropterin synthase
MLRSTKKFGPITTSHRNWRAAENPNRNSRKCSWCHGYSRYIQFIFDGEPDERGWVYDFGDLKFVKEWLEENWDHKTLVSSDDPKLDLLKQMDREEVIQLTIIPAKDGWGPGIEGCCKWVYDVINPLIVEKTNGRVRICKVEIWEHEFNTASYTPSDF